MPIYKILSLTAEVVEIDDKVWSYDYNHWLGCVHIHLSEEK